MSLFTFNFQTYLKPTMTDSNGNPKRKKKKKDAELENTCRTRAELRCWKWSESSFYRSCTIVSEQKMEKVHAQTVQKCPTSMYWPLRSNSQAMRRINGRNAEPFIKICPFNHLRTFSQPWCIQNCCYDIPRLQGYSGPYSGEAIKIWKEWSESMKTGRFTNLVWNRLVVIYYSEH